MLIQKTDSHVRILFYGTDWSFKDWMRNFWFLKRPYKNMDKVWFVHSGFLSEWREYKEKVRAVISTDTKSVSVHGVSQGGAHAVLCHEFLKYNFPWLEVETKTYGGPRVLGWFGFWRVKERFVGVTRYENRGDIVCHVPLFLMGFIHVGKRVLQGKFTFDIRKSHGNYSILD
jgi:hypothetical protein